MSTDLTLKIQPLDQFPAIMTKEMVAKALGIPLHIIPPLTRAGLIKPLGHPQRYCVKYYSRDWLAEQIASLVWLDKLAIAINRHWSRQNARKRVSLAGNYPAKSNQASESVAQ